MVRPSSAWPDSLENPVPLDPDLPPVVEVVPPSPIDRIRAARKAIVGALLPILVGLVVDLLSDAQTLLPSILAGVLTGGSVYGVRNVPAAPTLQFRRR